MGKRIGIIAALTLTAAAGFAACQQRGESNRSSSDHGNAAGAGTAPFVQEYLQVAEAAGAETKEFDEQFLADALRKLAAALGTLNLADLDVQVALRVAAEHVLSNPQSADTTAAVRRSLIAAAEAIEAGGASEPGLRQSAESLRPDRPLSDQVTTVREFLRKSGPAIRRAVGG
jgi:hypothetical protein